MPRTTTDLITARERARQARLRVDAERAKRDGRIEEAAALAFLALDARTAAETELGRAIGRLRDEDETQSRIADLLGLCTAEVKRLMPSAPKRMKRPPAGQAITDQLTSADGARDNTNDGESGDARMAAPLAS
jgi:hypothetical protein